MRCEAGFAGVGANGLRLTLLFEALLLSRARETRNGVAVRVVNGWSNLKRTFDKSVEGVAAWTLHDLRRTFATNLAALGTPST